MAAELAQARMDTDAIRHGWLDNRSMLSDQSRALERRLAESLNVPESELRLYLVEVIEERLYRGRESSERRTGFRFKRGTHDGMYVRDPEGSDLLPFGYQPPPENRQIECPRGKAQAQTSAHLRSRGRYNDGREPGLARSEAGTADRGRTAATWSATSFRLGTAPPERCARKQRLMRKPCRGAHLHWGEHSPSVNQPSMSVRSAPWKERVDVPPDCDIDLARR